MASNTTTTLKCFRCCNTSTDRNFLKYLGIPQVEKENNNYNFLKENFTDTISFPGTEQELGICAKCAYELFNEIVSGRPETQLVTFDANNGTVSPTSKQYSWGTYYRSLPTPERENYAFNGWWTELEDGEQITVSSIVSNSAELTLYAHWVLIRQVVTFDANGGSCEMTTRDYAVGETYSPLPDATLEQHVFSGWFTEADSGTQITEESPVSSDETRTLYAHWVAEE